jgi:hypothetical protein
MRPAFQADSDVWTAARPFCNLDRFGQPLPPPIIAPENYREITRAARKISSTSPISLAMEAERLIGADTCHRPTIES